jgi:hypothetical protein
MRPARQTTCRCPSTGAILGALTALALGALPAIAAAPPGRTTQPGAGLPADVSALFQAKCTRCHGGRSPKGGLDLTTLAGALKGGGSGPAIVPGKLEDSLLWEKVETGAMPPGKKGRLSAGELGPLRRWISEGARPATGESAPAAALTQHDVLPILLRRCTACHGPRRQEAGLDLHTRAAMLRGGKSGPAMVPGKSDESLLIKRARSGDMPPRQRLVEASVKPIEPAEIDVLARWIAAGAPEVQVEPDVATATPDPLVIDKDRDFWAFRAPRAVAVPAVTEVARVRNPIDAFILQKLQQHGLSLAPEADRATLLRRACFDLTGLPPEPEGAQLFLADPAPDAYEKLIDRLLASPHYGERWGRYWLDLAGYADSEGKREQDLPRPHAWRYRDYVIRSFNADKPYDRFLLEQIAGDELANYEKVAEITPEISDNLVATGFLRMAPDATWANITGYLQDRVEVIADEMDVLGSAVLGLTIKCARCHNHKFDPIPQRDYYRLTAIFKGAYDENDWLKPDVRPGLGPVSQDVLGGRNLPQVPTAERHQWEIAKPKGVAEPGIQALWDRGEPSPSYIYLRGDPTRPGRLVGPGVLSVLTDGKTPLEVRPPWPGAHKTGRRLAFARWLTQPNHPLTARVLVNRLWKHHFGNGIVKSLANFGKAGTPPSHPELLDWLAVTFVEHGWDIKAMHRLMMTSATYRQSSAVTATQVRLDPEMALFSRMPLVRLDAEALYDALLCVAGRLDHAPFGPGDAVQMRPDGLVTTTGTPRGWRRLIYAQQMRKNLITHLENFDYPQMNPNCIERRATTVAPQALHLMNSGMVQHLAEQFALRVRREVGSDPLQQVDRIFVIAAGRAPSEEERRVSLAALNKLAGQWAERGKASEGEAAQRALTALCHAVMNSAALLYVD